MITIEKIADKVIERIKAFPSEALFSQAEVGPKTTWDEYKENYQYEEYEFFDYELIQDIIKEMIEDEIEDLSQSDIKKLYLSINKYNTLSDFGYMLDEIEGEIFNCIHNKALSEDIEYKSPLYRYVKFWDYEDCDDGLLKVAEVEEKVSPEEYLLHVFSSETNKDGETQILSLTELIEDCGLEEITYEEFEEIKKTFFYNKSSRSYPPK